VYGVLELDSPNDSEPTIFVSLRLEAEVASSVVSAFSSAESADEHARTSSEAREAKERSLEVMCAPIARCDVGAGGIMCESPPQLIRIIRAVARLTEDADPDPAHSLPIRR